jgi:hypothetical protein
LGRADTVDQAMNTWLILLQSNLSWLHRRELASTSVRVCCWPGPEGGLVALKQVDCRFGGGLILTETLAILTIIETDLSLIPRLPVDFINRFCYTPHRSDIEIAKLAFSPATAKSSEPWVLQPYPQVLSAQSFWSGMYRKSQGRAVGLSFIHARTDAVRGISRSFREVDRKYQEE